jgi:hypothetical protein
LLALKSFRNCLRIMVATNVTNLHLAENMPEWVTNDCIIAGYAGELLQDDQHLNV